VPTKFPFSHYLLQYAHHLRVSWWSCSFRFFRWLYFNIIGIINIPKVLLSVKQWSSHHRVPCPRYRRFPPAHYGLPILCLKINDHCLSTFPCPQIFKYRTFCHYHNILTCLLPAPLSVFYAPACEASMVSSHHPSLSSLPKYTCPSNVVQIATELVDHGPRPLVSF